MAYVQKLLPVSELQSIPGQHYVSMHCMKNQRASPDRETETMKAGRNLTKQDK